jgi:transposase InsO family protein
VVIVRKKDGTPRFCIDYRKINNITQKDVYPLPRIDDIIEQLAGSTWFTKFDLKNGYFQVPISEDDKKKTAFATQDGLFEFNRLPQGLVNSPPTFQRIMNETLGNLRWKTCIVYLDDILVYSKSFDQHLKDVDTVCAALAKVNFQLNIEKCEFFQPEITFLGYKIHSRGMSPSDAHIDAISKFPVPKSAKHAYAFVQTANYFRKFIQNFSQVASPLTKFNKKEVPFIWGCEEQAAFDTLKQHLTSSPVLHLPNSGAMLKLQTDASDTGIGGVLLQWTELGYKPIGYASRLLTKTEKKYPTIEKEALGVWWCITQKFNTYLHGQRFTVETDHRPLSWINKQPYNNARVDRWGIALQEYDYEVKHIAGKKNQMADCLSRYPLEDAPEEEKEENDPVASQAHVAAIVTRAMARRGLQARTPEEKLSSNTTIFNVPSIRKHQPVAKENTFFDDELLREHQEKDPSIQSLLLDNNQQKKIVQNDGIVYMKKTEKDGRTHLLRYVPRSLIRNVLLIYHDSTFNGAHFGLKRTLYKVRNRYFWPNQFQDIQDHIASCVNCKKNNHVRRKPDGHLRPIEPPRGVFEKVAMDFVGKIPVSSRGNQYVIVLTDLLSKFTITKAVRDCTSTTASKFLVEDVMMKFGIPNEIITDNGSHFTSSLFEALTNTMGCCHIRITPYHAQSNGQCERFNATFLPKVLALMNEAKNNWDDKLSPTTFNFNNTRHSTTGYSPFNLMFARECRLPADPSMESVLPVAKEYEVQMKNYLNIAKTVARTNVRVNQEASKARHDRNRSDPEYSVGDQVVIRNQRPVNKLSQKFIGPYTVVSRTGDKTYQIQFDATSPMYSITVDKMQLMGRRNGFRQPVTNQ